MRRIPSKLLLAFAALLFSTALSAGEVATSYACAHWRHAELLRKVEISHLAPGCEVTYIKSDEKGNETGKVIYNAKNSTNYCDQKGSEFVTEKLEEKYGWSCYEILFKSGVGLKPEGVWTEPVTGMKFVSVPGGSFRIGDQFGGEDERFDDDEHNNRQITIKPFLLGTTEVTQGQWRAVMSSNPPESKGYGDFWRAVRSSPDDHPVEWVHFFDVQKFIKKLNARTGKRFRLPTEAEWEYACREGGRRVRFCNGKDTADPKEMNFHSSSDYKKPYSIVGEYRGETTPVASFAPNSLGLYDMSGNVYEWTCSAYNASYDGSEQECADYASTYSLRGGSWYSIPGWVRAADRGQNPDSRFTNDPVYSSVGIGFRLAQN